MTTQRTRASARRGGRPALAAAMLGLVLSAGACGQVAPSVPAQSPAAPPSTAATSPTISSVPEAGPCPSVPMTSPEGPAAVSAVLTDDGASPRVSAVVYPRPDYAGRPWSQWGQGLVLPDGRFLSAIGDHQGVDGNSFLFVYEPDQGRLTRFADVLSLVDHQPGAFGYGKIHAPLVLVGCDRVVFATYWGTRTGLAYGGSYTGDRVFSLDPATLAIEDLGVPVPQHGIPSLAGHGGLVYGEAVDPRGRPAGEQGDTGEFFVLDPESREVVFHVGDDRHIGFRTIGVDGAGRAFLAMPEGGLLRYDPGEGLSVHPASLPAGWLRATTGPAADGTVYGVTTQPERYVALRPDGRVDDLGPASGYTASLALSADGEELLAVPGAHGDAWQAGAPLLAVDVASGQEREVVALGPLVQRKLGLVLGGSYNVAVDPGTGRIFVGFNAGATSEEPWGEVVLVTVEP